MEFTLSSLKRIFPAACHDRVVVVGGSVRDMLLGKGCQDIDMVAALTPDELSSLGFRLVEATSGASIYFKYNAAFGKIEISCINDMADLQENLLTRDFSINAMAMTLAGVLIDPLGAARELQSGMIRTCSDQSFTSDPLRIFRAFRFEAEGWRMVPETEALIRGRVWGEYLCSMPVQRFSNEMLKALTKGNPENFFQRMVEFNVGAEFLPELFRMPYIPAGPIEHHPEGDLFSHSIQVLQRLAALSDDPLARFCAVFHDIGKLKTDPALYPKHHGHDEAGYLMADEFCARLYLPAIYRKALAWISRLHGKLNRWGELRVATKVKTADNAVKAGIADSLPLISYADKPVALPIHGWSNAVMVARMSSSKLGIDKKELACLPIDRRAAFILQKRVEQFQMLVIDRTNE